MGQINEAETKSVREKQESLCKAHILKKTRQSIQKCSTTFDIWPKLSATLVLPSNAKKDCTASLLCCFYSIKFA